MEKLDPTTDGVSKDLVADNIDKLRELFPDAFTEGSDADGPRWKVDFEALKACLGDYVEDERERYSFTWNGKARARRIAQTPSAGTLRPCPEESVNWDTTQNLFIEGDNLEVLKLLQKSYHKQVKMIYIDPPYNTGGEFIYPDRFQDNLDTYLRYTGQIDGEGFKTSANAESAGRYHTNWLNMMYPRLRLARNLLKDDGVIFISIDDNEQANLRFVCDEIFGPENFIGCIPVVSNLRGRSDDKYFATAHNYLIAYCRPQFISKGVPLPDEYIEEYSMTSSDGRRYRLQGLRKRGSQAKRTDRPKMHFPIYVDPTTSAVSLDKTDRYSEEVLPLLSDGTDGRWRWSKGTVSERIDELTGIRVGPEKRWSISQIDYLDSDEGTRRIIPKSVWMGSEFSNEAGTREVKNLFEGLNLFDNPKPISLIKYCLEQSIENDDLILDFFAGSCSSAHATIDYNLKNKYNARYVMVQLPELIPGGSLAFNSGYRTISEIAIERLRRLSKKISEAKELEIDRGFKVFKLSSSNIKQLEFDESNLSDNLFDQVDNLKHGRSPHDLLSEIQLKYGLDLSISIEEREINGKAVHVIGAGALVVCLADAVDIELVQGIAALKAELAPEVMRVVFKDNGFTDDVVKTNAVQILRQAGVEDVKSL